MALDDPVRQLLSRLGGVAQYPGEDRVYLAAVKMSEECLAREPANADSLQVVLAKTAKAKQMGDLELGGIVEQALNRDPRTGDLTREPRECRQQRGAEHLRTLHRRRVLKEAR